MDIQELGARVAKLRREAKLSQDDLASKASISRNYVSLLERGAVSNVSVKIIDQLATALQVRPNELMGQKSDMDRLIPVALRQLAREDGFSFDLVEKLANIPRRGQEPANLSEWRKLYDAVKKYL